MRNVHRMVIAVSVDPSTAFVGVDVAQGMNIPSRSSLSRSKYVRLVNHVLDVNLCAYAAGIETA